MVILYTTASCGSCRKAKAWLEENQIDYTEKNIVSNSLTVDELKSILRLTEEGATEIISTRSKIFQELNINIEALSLNEFYKLIIEYPQMLRRPIMLDEKRLQIGFNEEEIRKFLPRSVRTVLNIELQKLAN
ncbi:MULTISPECIES: transcriptional regulator SpxA [Bacillus]|jgi:regulatory protein spx|uniref:Global transcriptional regulator Spx n=2 Tax=Bacillus toyonensis TaxID=155322 RepID=A0A2B6MF27_9BACI|nr:MULTISPECIES: transcriptional regulator SpxA [Bacillus]EEL22157.1 Regulatory protein spx 1 [Bacillus cereus Rock1-3]EEL33709.1 Regulatory protein spx 1 [Bacillus cereus Rock3-28]EJR64370.1 regulatory protein spx 2 [Bacillus cereus VD115]EOP23872.1 regulatory protein spx 2 [Bacillus cereus VD131]KAB0445662.1 transcriptional regulator Spx [Lysinibacillus sp. VIA-II-2016]KNH40617.1 ArsR family transcriptional regulator [Bacillus thuringiensis]KXY20201.1 ArsR family transcriptional regulator 